MAFCLTFNINGAGWFCMFIESLVGYLKTVFTENAQQLKLRVFLHTSKVSITIIIFYYGKYLR